MLALHLFHDKESKAQGSSDREKQFKNDFFEEHHGRRGEASYVDDFAFYNPSEFDAYCAKRREAAVAREAAAASARRKRQSVREAAMAAAKALRDARFIARAASVAALARAAKVEKLTRASSIARGDPRSPAAHAALQQERRIRKKARRVAASVLKQTRRVAAIFVGRVIDAGVRRIASRVVSGGGVTGNFQNESLPAPPPRISSSSLPAEK
jgi:hypothetical protein